MDGKTRIVLPILMSGLMVLMVTLIVTFLNLGFGPSFLRQWLKAYCISWPIAAATGYAVMPGVRRATDWIVARLDT